jgi:hypothetical protein
MTFDTGIPLTVPGLEKYKIVSSNSLKMRLTENQGNGKRIIINVCNPLVRK